LRILLRVIGGPHAGRVFSFEEHDSIIVGRSNEARFRLLFKDEYLSRVHFLVELKPPRCRLFDLNSANGTFVNDERRTEVELFDGDLVRAGKTILRVVVEADSGSTSVPETVDPEAGPVAAGSFISASTKIEAGSPQSIANFDILRELGRGAMGVVYLASRRDDGSVVALKTIIPEAAGTEAQVERFLREARTLEALDHPNIVAFRAMGEAEGRLYFAMDYVRGIDASMLVKDVGGPLPVGRALSIGRQLLDGLAHAHALGFVHRDIKPSNLLVAEGGVAKLADFGLAKTYRNSKLSGLTLRGDVGGTIAYMAPEQITDFRGSGPSVDLYAAGATLYYLLTGCLVYDLPKTLPAQLAMILNQPPVPIRTRRADLPVALVEVIERSLDRNPSDRFADATAMSEALAPFG
jgi:eukaryotic-like serine/threonine-protein kinase